MNIKYKTNSPLNLIGGLKYCSKYDTHSPKKRNFWGKNNLAEFLYIAEIGRIDETK